MNTDPNLTLFTRRGTAITSALLKGVWYRGPFGHGGEAATLEEWLDPQRVKEGYVRSGSRGTKPQPVKGHEFGFSLNAEERQALVAFLKTL